MVAGGTSALILADTYRAYSIRSISAAALSTFQDDSAIMSTQLREVIYAFSYGSNLNNTGPEQQFQF